MTDPTLSRHATVSCPFCATLNRVDLARLSDGPRCGSCGRPLRLDRPQPVPGDALDRIVGEADVPVLIDFYADWCGPCKVMAPILDDFARARAGEVLVTKLDTDRNPATSERLGIRAIPTLIVFSKGREAARQAGVMSRQQLDALVAAAARS